MGATAGSDTDTLSDLKIALCMAGQMRTYKKCYGELKESVLDPLNPDVFIHTEEKTGITKRASRQTVEEAVENTVTEDTLNCLYDPKKFEITEPFSAEDLREFAGVQVPDVLIEAEPDHWQGNIPNFYGIHACNELKKGWEQQKGFEYDIVIRMRPDLLVPRRLPLKALSNPEMLWHTQTGCKISDKLAISNSKNMDYYASVWKKLSDYWRNPLGDGDRENHRVGERLLRHHIGESDIKVRQFDIGSYQLRSRTYLREIIRREMHPQNRYVPNKVKMAINNPVEAMKYPFQLLRRNLQKIEKQL